ncbi:hypothetical protein ACFFX0_16850 [Citricoccus parietis]|uniref:Uncharacterized protein n=1 Tax=Citricoccus parietis TaxID=592307 RepID=A0ABV5G1G1_9MICC
MKNHTMPLPPRMVSDACRHRRAPPPSVSTMDLRTLTIRRHSGYGGLGGAEDAATSASGSLQISHTELRPDVTGGTPCPVRSSARPAPSGTATSSPVPGPPPSRRPRQPPLT